jgi:mono/diheme cytochrome c family protein
MMMRRTLVLAIAVGLAGGAAAAGGDPDRYAHFQDRVLPLLQARCVSCHGPEKQKGGLRLDSRAMLVKGGETGPAIVPGDPEKSLLIQAVRQTHAELKMPPKEKVAADQVDILVRWIREGVAWPEPAAVLFEDEREILDSITEGKDAARLSTNDRHSGSSSLVVKKQSLSPAVAGWSFPIAEHPKAGEFRYLRFAWKKRGGGAIFFELANAGKWRTQQQENNASWVAGSNTTGWNAFAVAAEAPVEWTIVTRDLWKDRGNWDRFTVTGFCLTAVDGGEALLDAVILGPTIESLDAYRPGRIAPALASSGPKSRLGDAWSDPQNPIVRIFGGKRLDLWSLRTVRRPAPPSVKNEAWVRTPIDRFILAALEAASLTPSAEADRRTLIRRVTFDLTGLPPSPEEVKAFVEDPASNAYDRLVDRLLASPRYGERWARHWMDVVRYADTQGFERDELQPQIWRYRDYLIRSFNADKPYSRFVREQLAGDETGGGDPDALIATGYLRLGPYDSTGSIFMEDAKNRNELMTDLANTTGSAFLGLTVACANCHDHKYDPISQADHFRLRAFFAGVKRQDDTIIDRGAERERIQKHNDSIEARTKPCTTRISEILEPARKALQEQRPKEKKISDADATASLDDELRNELALLRQTVDDEKKGLLEFTRGMTVRDSGAKPPPTHLFYQGDFTQPREEIAPGFISVLDPNAAAVTPPAGMDSSGRRAALADWIASPENPLAARVIVNRLWHHHFGRGIVATPNDFGFSGVRPTHPELLDALASELAASGGSLKTIHRMILRSATYRQRSLDDAAKRAADPENRLLWRQNPRRLDAEATRDALLVVSGTLLPKDSGPPVWPPVPQHLLDAQPGILETKSDKLARDRMQEWYTDPLEKADVRSIFLVQKRVLTLPFLQPFDLPDLNVSCGRRDVTTVAPQALQLLNSAFSERMAVAFAARVEREAGEEARIDRAVWLALGRPPSEPERRRSLDFIHRHRLVDFCRVLLNINEFVYVD